MDKTIFGVEIYALMRDKEEIGRFEIENDELVLNLKEDIDINSIPYTLRLNAKDNLVIALEQWVSQRLLQKDRIGIKGILKGLGIKSYNKTELFKKGHASMMKDPYWIAFSPDDVFEECTQRGQMGVTKYID